MNILRIVAAAAFLVLGTAYAADVAEGKPAQQKGAAGEADDQDQMEQVGAPAQSSGMVMSKHTVDLVGMSEPHVLVKIKADDGETDIVDLGSSSDLKSNGLEPREGQKLWVSGRVGRINDKELIVAENISEAKMVTLARNAPLREESEKHAAAREAKKDGTDKDNKDAKTVSVDPGMQTRTVDGSVMHTRKVKIEGEADEHLVAKLQTENGVVVVDLGCASKVPKVDLKEGQPVAVTGFVGHLNNRPIIVADSIGNLSSIERPETEGAPEPKIQAQAK